MNNSHASGATIGALVSFVSARYGWNVSTDEGLTIGAAAASVGAAVAHLFSAPGLVPRVRSAIFGPQ